MKCVLFISLIFLVSTYDRSGAVNYAYKYWSTPNHECRAYEDCSPCAYYGSEACNYPSHGGDCANFVSQCLVLGGGHEKLKGSKVCRGYPCGFEEPEAKSLGDCLKSKGWTSTCGKNKDPPSNIDKGDVLIYHKSSCDDYAAHAVLVTIGGSNPKITCHSSNHKDVDYTYMTSKPYFQWLHKN